MLLFSLSLSSQVAVDLAAIKDSLIILGETIRDSPEFDKRKKANERFSFLLEEYLSFDEGYSDPLKEVQTMVSVSEEDYDFRIFTWLLPDSLFQLKAYGMIAAKTRRGIQITSLEDQKRNLIEPEFLVLKPRQWYGAIYYKLITTKKGRKKIYTLLGYSPDKPIQRKIVEIISIDKRGRPKFGAKVFYIEDFMDKKFRKAPMRLILSYSSEYSATVKWNEEEEMIIMDHLSPPNPRLKGLYDMYGPDMTYDGLEWDDDWWHLRPQVKFNSRQEIEFRPPDRPIGPEK